MGITVIGMERTRENIGKKAPAHFRNLTKPLRRVGIYMRDESISQNFKQGGRPKKWAALSAATKVVNPKRSTGLPLQDTGAHIRNRISLNVTKDTMTIGVSGKIPYVQHYGAQITVTQKMRNYLASKGLILGPLKKIISIPARPFLMFQKEDINVIKDIFNKWAGEYKS